DLLAEAGTNAGGLSRGADRTLAGQAKSCIYTLGMAVTGAPELLIVMGGHATSEQIDDVVARLEEAGCAALVTPGREATVIGAIGERELLAALPLEGYAGVEQVLPTLNPNKPVPRAPPPAPTVIAARGRRMGDGYF